MENITIPLELFDGRYNDEEIFVICALMAAPHLDNTPKPKWMDDEKYTDVITSLISRNIIVKDNDGNITIDLTTKKASDLETLLRDLNPDTVSKIRDIIRETESDSYADGYTQGYSDARIDFAP
jgi:hypothetical protein